MSICKDTLNLRNSFHRVRQKLGKQHHRSGWPLGSLTLRLCWVRVLLSAIGILTLFLFRKPVILVVLFLLCTVSFACTVLASHWRTPFPISSVLVTLAAVTVVYPVVLPLFPGFLCSLHAHLFCRMLLGVHNASFIPLYSSGRLPFTLFRCISFPMRLWVPKSISWIAKFCIGLTRSLLLSMRHVFFVAISMLPWSPSRRAKPWPCAGGLIWPFFPNTFLALHWSPLARMPHGTRLLLAILVFRGLFGGRQFVTSMIWTVQKFDLDVPSYNVPVFKWPQPRALHEFHCNHSGLRTSALQIAGPLRQQVSEALSTGDATSALKLWSSACEKAIICNSTTDDGEPLVGKRYLGRAANLAPVKRVLSAPRFKPGRKSDFVVSFPSVALKVRQVQKQARRLQSLVRLLKSQFFSQQHFGKVHDLWNAVSRSSGFVPCFLSWASSSIGSPIGALPDFETLCVLKDLVCAYANRLASQQWRLKKEIFTTQLEVSMKTGGGKLAFRCLKERALPQVRSLKVVEELKLAPQRWLPTGKSWFHVVNHFAFNVGDMLEGEDFTVKLLEKQGDSLHVDKLLTRRQAAHLCKTFVTSDPDVWAPHFLSKWSDFWNRDDPNEVRTEHVPFLEAMEATPEVDFGPLTLSHWHQALRTSKSSTMCGTDNWCIPDLKLLPDSLTSVLLDIYNAIETSGISWPVQLYNWLLVVLRKTDCDTPDWTLLRPISVAGILYRLWARMRTVDCMRHCKSFRTPLVAPNLSTRAIWYFLSDYFDQQYTLGERPCGVVLDIIKCFNILSRDVVYDIMVTLGFPERVLGAWFRALSSMSRSVLVDGAVFGQQSASAGVPEGDPLAVIAMFCVSLAFYKFIKWKVPEALVCTYADNWEAVCSHPDVLAKLLLELRPFLSGLKLPINPQKCWTWSLDPEHRKQLKTLRWDGEQCFPVKLQARELGADISYSLRKAARVRNQRIATGHQRLLRLAGLPLPRLCKQRLLFSGIFPQTLHASETAIVPKSVYDRLRSKTALSVGAAKKGSNPYIACLLACPRIVDPQFVQILGRVRLFRQVLRELPSYTDVFLDGLSANNGRYKGPSRILRKELHLLGWTLFGRATFGDLHGRSFHLVLTPILHIEYLLSTSWSQYVTERVTHRKGLEHLTSLELDFCRVGPGFRPNEQGLLLNQQSGAFFTEDYRKHIPGSSTRCPLCGQADSRAHRLESCPHTDGLRQIYSSLFQSWDSLAPHENILGGLRRSKVHVRFVLLLVVCHFLLSIVDFVVSNVWFTLTVAVCFPAYHNYVLPPLPPSLLAPAVLLKFWRRVWSLGVVIVLSEGKLWDWPVPCTRCLLESFAVIAFPLSISQTICWRSCAPKLPPNCRWNIWTCGPGFWKDVNLAVCAFIGLRVTSLGGKNMVLPGCMPGTITGLIVLQLRQANGLLVFPPSIPCSGTTWFGNVFPELSMIITFRWPSHLPRRSRSSKLNLLRLLFEMVADLPCPLMVLALRVLHSNMRVLHVN